jgi:hypothetical protein
VPDVADLAALALKRAYQRLEAGEAGANVRDVVALARLATEVEHDQTAAELGKAIAGLAGIQQAFRIALWTVRRHFGPARIRSGGGPSWTSSEELERVAGRLRPGAAAEVCYAATMPRAL